MFDRTSLISRGTVALHTGFHGEKTISHEAKTNFIVLPEHFAIQFSGFPKPEACWTEE